ncbi:hypothetical protein HOC13_01780 [Candidatus Woesearchaeota archaeon]|jgi:hypothetical protein|nr:hypothetical protein [Candidatus Woesearchaeota archaeon]
MISFHEAHQQLLKSIIFKDWKSNHDSSYLSHFYCQVDSKLNQTTSWELGFYLPKEDKITTFIVAQEVAIKAEDEVFKKEGTVDELPLEEVKTTLTEISPIIQELLQKEYSKEIFLTGFLILQKYQGQTMWNVSFATKSLNIVNIKVNTQNKEVISHQSINFIEQKAS